MEGVQGDRECPKARAADAKKRQKGERNDIGRPASGIGRADARDLRSEV